MSGGDHSTEFRTLMGRWATGVSVVTARDKHGDAGLTVNALFSVSLRPPSLLISLTQDADTTPVIERAGAFAVNFLGADQRALSERFALAVPSTEKFQGVAFHRGASGAPLLEGALAHFECEVAAWIRQYDHVLIVGEVVAARAGPEGAPLVFYLSDYARAEGPDRLRLPTLPR